MGKARHLAVAVRTRQDLLRGRAGFAGTGPALAIATPERAHRSGATNRRCQIMPNWRNKEWVIPSAFKGISPFTRHYSKLGTTSDLWFDDLNVDGIVSTADVDTLIHTIFQTEYGDSTLNGSVDTIDFNVLASNFGKTSGVGWASADFNGDGRCDTLDFNLLATHFGFHFTSDMLPGAGLGSVVPEPTSLASLGLMSAMLLSRTSR